MIKINSKYDPLTTTGTKWPLTNTISMSSKRTSYWYTFDKTILHWGYHRASVEPILGPTILTTWSK